MRSNSGQSNHCESCSTTASLNNEVIFVVDECDAGLTNFLRSEVPEGFGIVSIKEEYSGMDETYFIPDLQQRKHKRFVVFTSDKNDFTSFTSPDCCVIVFANGGIKTQTKIDLITRLFNTPPFRDVSNLFSFQHITLERDGWVRYSRSDKQKRKRLRTPHPHSHKPLSFPIKNIL